MKNKIPICMFFASIFVVLFSFTSFGASQSLNYAPSVQVGDEIVWNMFLMGSDGFIEDKMIHEITEIENTEVHEYNGTQILANVHFEELGDSEEIKVGLLMNYSVGAYFLMIGLFSVFSFESDLMIQYELYLGNYYIVPDTNLTEYAEILDDELNQFLFQDDETHVSSSDNGNSISIVDDNYYRYRKFNEQGILTKEEISMIIDEQDVFIQLDLISINGSPVNSIPGYSWAILFGSIMLGIVTVIMVKIKGRTLEK